MPHIGSDTKIGVLTRGLQTVESVVQEVRVSRQIGEEASREHTSGNVPVRELERKSRKRRPLMPDQARGSRSASMLKPRRSTCSLVSFPSSSGNCPMSAFLCKTGKHVRAQGSQPVQNSSNTAALAQSVQLA